MVFKHRIPRRPAWERTVILLVWATMPLIGCTIPDEPVDDAVLLVNCHPGQDCNFESSDGRVHLFIPAAAIPETGLDITAKPASNPTGSMTLIPGTAWDVGPTGTTFNPRAQLSIAYDTALVQGLAGVRESELGLYEDSSQQWHIVDSLVLDTAGTTVTAWIAGLSVYGILGAPVDTVLVSPSPAAVVVGQTLQLTAEPRSANQVVLPDRPVTWSTRDAAIARVNTQRGVVTGVGIGATSILATASQGNPGSAMVTVDTLPGGVGDLEVSNTTTGPDADSDYTVTVDGTTSQPLLAGGTVTFSGLSAGDHTVELGDVAVNCTVSGDNPRIVSVAFNTTAQTTFDVSCTSVPPVITGVSWACSALITDAVGSDLWPITWSDDDNQYTAWGDGFGFDGQPTKSGRGISRLQGDPTTYTASDLFHSDDGGGAPFIEGIGSVGGVLYMIYNQGPTRELWKSTDKGLSETGPLASWPATGHQPRYFVQMGRDNGASDGYGYMRMTGSTGDATQVYVARALEANIENQNTWEIFTGTVQNPSWSTDFSGATQIFSGSDAHISITYFPPLAKFIGVSGWDGGDLGNLNIYQAPNVYGPYTSIQSYTNWCGWGSEPTPRARHVSPKWLSADGSEFWMAFSGGGMWDRFNLIKGTFQLQ